MENFVQLNSDEKNILDSVYGRQIFGGVGYNPNKLEAIKDLTAQEKKFFAGKNFVSPNFYVQTLYKVSGSVGPMKFNVAVNRTLNDNENLRANFCPVGTRTVKVIQPAATLKPEIVFRNLTQVDSDELDDEFRKILEADMRREFDLRHDLLIRFAVFKTSNTAFAVLVTVAQLIADSFDAEKFFALVTDSLAEVQSSKNIQPTANELGKYINLDAVREYWSKVLYNAPPLSKLPYERTALGAYRQKAHRTKIPADILSDLRARAQSNRMMLTAILQSAWGFMLQTVNKRADCLFSQILSGGKNGNSLSLIPVRVVGENELTVEKIVRQQFRQLIISQPYSNFDWDELDNLTGHKKMFDHFLSFKEFQSNELNYSATAGDPCGKIILRNSWDAQGMKLGAYFRYSEKNLTVTFLYDDRQFPNNGVVKLCALFNLILQQMLTDWNSKFYAFRLNLEKRIEQLTAEKISHEDARIKIRNFLSQLPILQGRYEGTINIFDGQSTIETFYEGDRISGDVLEQNFIFVVSGKLARSVDTGDGWYNPIDIVRRNGFINPTNFLEERRLTLSAEVLTEQADLLLIPHNVLIDAFNHNPEIARGLVQYALIQMEKYQALWLQS